MYLNCFRNPEDPEEITGKRGASKGYTSTPIRRMENADIPQKRRKIDETDNVPGYKNTQTQPITSGELKRNSSKVLINKLDLNKDIVERLRRITMAYGEKLMAEKAKTRSFEEDKVEVMNWYGNKDHRKIGEREDNGISEAGDKALTTADNGAKDVKATSLETFKDDKEINKQTTADMQNFRQVLKEVIEERTKVVEEAFVSKLVHLQYRIQQLERENKELRWNAKRLLDVFKKYITEATKGPGDFPTGPAILRREPKCSGTVTTAYPDAASFTSASRPNATNSWKPDELARNEPTNHEASHKQQKISFLGASTSVVFTATSQPLEQPKTTSGIVSQIRTSLLANSPSERIGQNRGNVIELRELLQEQRQLEQKQQVASKPWSLPAQQLQQSAPKTAHSLIQQLQMQEQNQQCQNYQKVESHKQTSKECNNVLLSGQIRQEQITPNPDPLTFHNLEIQQQSVIPSSKELRTSQPKELFSNVPLNRVTSFRQLKQSQSHQNATVHAPSLACSTSINSGDAVNKGSATLNVPSGQSKNILVPHSKDDKQVSSKDANRHPDVEDQEDFISSNRSHSTEPLSPVQVTNDGCRSAERQRVVPLANVGANGGTHRDDSTPQEKCQRAELHQQPSVIKRTQQGMLVPTRRKQKVEDVLPIGFRYSLPSPEYFLQQKPMQRQLQCQQSQTGLGEPQSQSLKRILSDERLIHSARHRREPTGVAQTKQPSSREIQITQGKTMQTETTCNQNFRKNAIPRSGNQLIQAPLGNESLQKNAQEVAIHDRRPIQPARPVIQDQQQQTVKASENVNERSVQSRPPIQSPGITSSAPLREKHLRDPQRTSAPRLANTSLPLRTTANQASIFHLPKPSASIAVMSNGIVLSWNMTYNEEVIKIDNYELFACQDIAESNGHPIRWKKIGIVKALPLPMACTLTQFSSGSKYFFSVRAVDERERAGPFSDPCTVSLNS